MSSEQHNAQKIDLGREAISKLESAEQLLQGAARALEAVDTKVDASAVEKVASQQKRLESAFEVLSVKKQKLYDHLIEVVKMLPIKVPIKFTHNNWYQAEIREEGFYNFNSALKDERLTPHSEMGGDWSWKEACKGLIESIEFQIDYTLHTSPHKLREESATFIMIAKDLRKLLEKLEKDEN